MGEPERPTPKAMRHTGDAIAISTDRIRVPLARVVVIGLFLVTATATALGVWYAFSSKINAHIDDANIHVPPNFYRANGELLGERSAQKMIDAAKGEILQKTTGKLDKVSGMIEDAFGEDPRFQRKQRERARKAREMPVLAPD